MHIKLAETRRVSSSTQDANLNVLKLLATFTLCFMIGRSAEQLQHFNKWSIRQQDGNKKINLWKLFCESRFLRAFSWLCWNSQWVYVLEHWASKHIQTLKLPGLELAQKLSLFQPSMLLPLELSHTWFFRRGGWAVSRTFYNFVTDSKTLETVQTSTFEPVVLWLQYCSLHVQLHAKKSRSIQNAMEIDD